MRISIHQSHYLPWLRYFDKIARSDVFVLLDDAQFNRNGWQNRNRVKGPGGGVLLTVPVLQHYQQGLEEVRCNNTVRWQRKHWKTIAQLYGKAPYFHRYQPMLQPFYERQWESLNELNYQMLTCFLQALEIETRIVCSHELGITEASTARLLAICQELGATEYLSGAHAIGTYLDPVIFETAGVRLLSQEWSSPIYEQLFPSVGYVPDLAIVDLLFMSGPSAMQVLMSGGGLGQEGRPVHA